MESSCSWLLSADERESLEDLARRRKTAQGLALRARIVLACAEGRYSGEVARSLRVTPQTVCKWRARFVQKRLEGLLCPGEQAGRRDALEHYLRVYKLNPKPLVWTKTADEILASVARLCRRISNSGH
jgi:hypothetical protein